MARSWNSYENDFGETRDDFRFTDDAADLNQPPCPCGKVAPEDVATCGRCGEDMCSACEDWHHGEECEESAADAMASRIDAAELARGGR